MNYAYIVCSREGSVKSSTKSQRARVEKTKQLILGLKNMLKSLNNNCDCTLLVNTFGIDDDFFKELTSSFSKQIIKYEMSKEEWVGKKMFCKIKRLLEVNFKHGDNVFVLDIDLLIQDDIYKVFEKDFDVCYTTRSQKSRYSINDGVWGFKYNERSNKFLEFYINQMLKPSWVPYVEFRKKFKHKGLNWWCDQDFLCTVYNEKGKLPFECKLLDIGQKYNFLINDKKDITLVGDKEHKILHFRGINLNTILADLEI